MDDRRTFQVGDWVAIRLPIFDDYSFGRITTHNGASFLPWHVLLLSPAGQLDAYTFSSAELVPYTPTEEELATWVLLTLTQ